jgi:predicted nucleic acid-binding protein
MKYVIDASVATKLFINEDYSDKAIEVMEAYVHGYLSLSAPTLIVYELGNVFWKHPEITAEKAYVFIKRFFDLKINLIDIYSDNKLLEKTCEISRDEDITFYDASYIAIAQGNKARLITADEEICGKIPDITVSLRDFKR